jgi:hypothetical protein
MMSLTVSANLVVLRGLDLRAHTPVYTPQLTDGPAGGSDSMNIT